MIISTIGLCLAGGSLLGITAYSAYTYVRHKQLGGMEVLIAVWISIFLVICGICTAVSQLIEPREGISWMHAYGQVAFVFTMAVLALATTFVSFARSQSQK